MPTPQSTFFRPDSLSKGGTCTMNLRGNLLYDYANQNTSWSLVGPLSIIPVSQETPWKYFIPNSFNISETTSITRNTLLSTSIVNFTIMFHFYAVSLLTPGATGFSIFTNGDPNSGGWDINVNGGDEFSLQFLFSYQGDKGKGVEVISSEYIQPATWYHVAVTIQDSGKGFNLFTGFVNGTKTDYNTSFPAIMAPSGNTIIGDIGTGQSQSFQLTNLVFLESYLQDYQIIAYAKSAYI